MAKQIVDAVTFGGELDMLEGRLRSVDADRVFIVEGTHTFTNNEKGLILEANQSRFAEFWDRIEYVPVQSALNDNAWQNEYHQRSQLTQALTKAKLHSDDVVGIFDVDEWPDVDMMRDQDGPLAWRMQKFQMSFHWFQQVELTGVSARWSDLADGDVDRFRWSRHNLTAVDAGFHFSSFGVYDDLVLKMNSFAHQELRKTGDWLTKCFTEGLAVENGQAMNEVDLLDVFPDWVKNHEAPESWYRRRAA